MRGTLFQKYAAYFAGLVSIALLASGAMSLYFAYLDTRSQVEELQREKARGAALRIELFIDTLVSQLRAVLLSRQGASPADLQEMQFELLRLLRAAPAVVDVAWIDANGVQQIKVSRLSGDELGAGRDLSGHPGVAAARAGMPYFGLVYFRQESEPYMSLAVAGRPDAGVALAEVNLKFVWEVVSAIRVGKAGFAYVVDAAGRLVSHPDISLVLGARDLSRFAPVSQFIAEAGSQPTDIIIGSASADGTQRPTLTSQALIPNLGWHVLVEQPLREAFAPLYASAARTGVLLLLGVLLSVAAGIVLARRMADPIRRLQEGASRIGQGRLQERVDIASEDELGALASQFNRMAEQLRESYSGLEQKIEERTRQLAAANQAKSRFLAAASHDLRQPVHALGLYVAQLEEAGSTAERDSLLAKVKASTGAVAELLEALLDISKLDAGVVMPQPVAFAIQPVLNRLEASFSIAAQEKGLRLRVRPSALRVSSDPVLLQRILMNLAANAVRYTREGGVLIGCRRRAARVRIEVWDTGIGISPEQRERIFEEFYQAPSVAGEGGRGLGLGLAIVERLARLLELDMLVRSTEGRGSVFEIELPFAREDAVTPGARVDTQLAMRFDGAVALLLDDDTEAREAAVGLLKQWGWRVLSCATGKEALAALGQPPVPLDVIISDYHLAQGEVGTQVIESLRQACGAQLPAILVSGDVQADLRDLAREAGIHLMFKPLQAAKLRSLLHHLLSRDEVER